MADTDTEKQLGQQAQAFIEENKELLEDPETSSDVLGRIYEHGTDIIVAFGKAYEDAVAEELPLAKRYNEAQTNTSLSPKELQKREVPYKRAKEKAAQRYAAFERFKGFMEQVNELYEVRREEEQAGAVRQDFDEDDNHIADLPNAQQMRSIGEEEGRKMAEGMQVELSKHSAAPGPVPWWKRLLGVHQERPSEAPRSAREAPTTPSPLASDPEDYEKLLTWYEQNLEVLERAVAGRQAGEPGEWSQVVDELLGRMAWCDRNMDAIEERNAEVASSELAGRRKNLVSRRSELEE